MCSVASCRIRCKMSCKAVGEGATSGPARALCGCQANCKPRWSPVGAQWLASLNCSHEKCARNNYGCFNNSIFYGNLLEQDGDSRRFAPCTSWSGRPCSDKACLGELNLGSLCLPWHIFSSVYWMKPSDKRNDLDSGGVYYIVRTPEQPYQFGNGHRTEFSVIFSFLHVANQHFDPGQEALMGVPHCNIGYV